MDNNNNVAVQSPRPRGFAAMSSEQRKSIARMGGIAAHERATAHQFSSAEATSASKKRGKLAKRVQTAVNSII